MFIQTETTPNPNTIKFLPGCTVASTVQSFTTFDEEKNPTLVNKLFLIGQIQEVFLGEDFISVTKTNHISWDLLKAEILTTITEHFTSDDNPVNIEEADDSEEEFDPKDHEIVAQIKEILYMKVRPAVRQDGGNIIFHGYSNGVVKLKLQGACSGCPSAAITLKDGIENMLQYYIPEVETVEEVE